MENNSYTNNVGRHRFNQTFQSSLRDQGQERFMTDKSLIKGIKENDLTKIIDVSEERGTTQQKQIYDQHKQISENIIQIRKKYDEIKTETKHKTNQLEKMRKNVEQLQEEEKKYHTFIKQTNNKLEEMKINFEDMKFNLSAKTFDKDIYINIQDRNKDDILVLKKRFFDKDLDLTRNKTKVKSLKNEAFNKTKLSTRCKQLLQSIQKTVVTKQKERNNQISEFCDVLTRKQDNLIKKGERQKELQEVMVSAMTDKLQQEKQWMKILLANIFVNKLLRFKMTQVIKSNQQIELAFHKIKQNTDIADSSELIQRFITREQSYGSLLDSIAEKEKKIQKLKEENSHYFNQNKMLNDQADQISDQNRKYDNIPENKQKIMQNLRQNLISIQEQKQMIYRWSSKFYTAFNNLKNREETTKTYPRSKIIQLFSLVLQNINNFLDSLNQKKQDSQKNIDKVFLASNLKERTMNQDMFERNTRIKTMSTHENTESYEAMRNKDFHDDLSQIDYLRYNRRTVKKNEYNRKFRIKTKPY